MWRIVLPTIQEFGTLDVPLLSAPPPFRFAEPAECGRVLTEVGFAGITATSHTNRWTGRDGQAVRDLLYQSIVQAPLLIEAQTREAREKIRVGIRARAEEYRRGDHLELRFPYLLVTPTKPR